MSEPFPTGTVLGAVEGGFDVYVVPRNSPPLKTAHTQWSVVVGDDNWLRFYEANSDVQDVTILVGSPEEQQREVHFTIGMSGHLLDSGTVYMIDGRAKGCI